MAQLFFNCSSLNGSKNSQKTAKDQTFKHYLPHISPILMFPTAEPTETRQKEWGGTEGPNPPGCVKQIDNKREGLEPPLFVSNRSIKNEEGSTPPRPRQNRSMMNGVEPSSFASKQVDNKWGGLKPPPFVSNRSITNKEGRTLLVRLPVSCS